VNEQHCFVGLKAELLCPSNIVETNYLSRLDLRVSQDPVIAEIPSVLHPKDVCGKHHRDEHARKVVGLPVKNRENSLPTRHMVHVVS
jgi:hypothetical protein